MSLNRTADPASVSLTSPLQSTLKREQLVRRRGYITHPNSPRSHRHNRPHREADFGGSSGIIQTPCTR
jgi:hypothetical protein